jgi:predicted transcriptional regulator
MSNDVSTTTTQAAKTFGFQISEDLEARLTAAATALQLSKSGVARLAIERGLPVLEAQLATAPELAESAL